MLKKLQKALGFTLVELSIVLVIIGLLIGGIVAAQSIISTSKITRVVKDLSQYNTAIQSFLSAYGTTPGDSNMFTPVGNADGYTTTNINPYDEILAAWAHLSLGVDFKNSAGTSYTAASCLMNLTGKTTCPLLDLPHSSSVYHPCLLLVGGLTGFPKNTLIYSSADYFLSSCSNYAPLSPKDVFAIDKKTDDGIANTGSVTDATINFGGSACSSAGNYDVNSTSTYCSMRFDIDTFAKTGYR